MKPYLPPLCRSVDIAQEKALLTGSTETYPVDPFDPDF